ncbi:hypothetical protein C450_03637 [Halococcus salifodinae DSM 8989]|uniref:Uncharacterized protein n=1 Tax=Halococcus salifodinae DSM 8989 TaxID=1227456 RepID=M0NC32_9EURY|nr:hypothetical protein C450_03637 [Halococcus salifodinae DSM 8989]
MGRNSASETDSSDPDARIDTHLPATDRSNRTTETLPPDPADTSNAEQSRFFGLLSDPVNENTLHFGRGNRKCARGLARRYWGKPEPDPQARREAVVSNTW